MQIKVDFSLSLRGCQATSYWLYSVRVMFPDRTDTGGKKRGHRGVLCVLTAAPGLTHPICAEDVTACISWYICCVLLLTQKGGKRFWPQPVTPVGLFLGQVQPHMARTQRSKLGSAFRQQHGYCQSRSSNILAFHVEPAWNVPPWIKILYPYSDYTSFIFNNVSGLWWLFFLLPKESLIMHQDSDQFFHFGKTDLVSSITPPPRRRKLLNKISPMKM